MVWPSSLPTRFRSLPPPSFPELQSYQPCVLSAHLTPSVPLPGMLFTRYVSMVAYLSGLDFNVTPSRKHFLVLQTRSGPGDHHSTYRGATW